MTPLILRCKLALGDLVLLTAAVRDLHRACPGRFLTDVRTAHPEVWENTPHLTALDEYAPDVRVIDCDYPLVQQSNTAARHCLHGFTEFLSGKLGRRIPLTEFRGDIHLSPAELISPCAVHTLVGAQVPFWLIASGGKSDYTVKWWDPRRYQAVVDHFRGRILFVQVGAAADHHPPLRGVLDLRGRTSIRQLILLMHQAQGVLCGVTSLMHLAAAVPGPAGAPPARPCVVVAGGREPPAWEAYPGHQFLHTVGQLPCCAATGCWRSRLEPLGDKHECDGPDQICVDVRQGLPRCMDLISTDRVIAGIEGYFEGGVVRYLSNTEARAADRAVSAQPGRAERLNRFNAPALATEFIRSIPAYPGGFTGRGIVICGGGVRMFTNAWVTIRMLRHLGCTLPIELWHWGEEELDETMRQLVTPCGVHCVNGLERCAPESHRLFNGWAMKPLALLHSAFREALLLDADNLPVADPTFLFDAPPYREAGAVLWPDFKRLPPGASAWRVFDVPFRDEPEVESGQVLVDKARCWRSLQLCVWYNQHAETFYQHVYGDKDTFHFAFRRTGEPYAMPAAPVRSLGTAMVQHDFDGRALFHHRNGAKWRLFGHNPVVRGFRHETRCREFLAELGAQWNGRIRRPGLPSRVSRPTSERPAGTPNAHPEVTLAAVMPSYPLRHTMREQTLARLAATDWGHRPVRVALDRRFPNRHDNIAYTSWCALQAGLKTGAEYLLYLEDDLDFNRHLYHNLQQWPRLRARQVTLATLYNPALPEMGWDIPPSAFAVDPRGFFGAQALVISRAAAEHLVQHWLEAPGFPDLRIRDLLASWKRPLFCHNPSLVQHRGRRSSWGGFFHTACDFDPDWKAPTDWSTLAP
ncbi:MAG TPA: glycosyltransferase family 9 protein [Methylomirabilota bacterium]|nr:glycosyltransferase family 9 protein [Methylomirabilota bacterium]